ncbi:dihydrodipicolinate synthase family protein [Duganella sp. PWIR1]
MLTSLHGIWVPLVTPMHHGEIDLEGLQRLAERVVDDGVHGLVVCGTTGEAPQLDLAEQSAALAAVLEVARRRSPVLMGIGGSDTFDAASRLLEFDDADLAGYLVSTPAYVRPSQEGLLRHFETIADATARPIVLYNVPARTGVKLELATACRLAQRPQFAAIKEAGGSLRQMTDLVRAQRLAEARALANALLPMMQLLFSEPNPAPLKAALSMQGSMREELRLPMVPATLACKEKLAGALEALDGMPPYRPAAAGAKPDSVRYSLAHAMAAV